MLCRLTSEKGDIGFAARIADGFDDCCDRIDIKFADGDIVGESDGGCAGSGEIVGDHGNDVIPEGVYQSCLPCELGLGTDTVGRHHQDGCDETGRDLESCGETPEIAHDILGPGGGDPPTDPLDEFLCGIQVHTGLPVAAGHDIFSSRNLLSASGTSVG